MLRVGMVGMGGISTAHITAWELIQDAKIIAVCDIQVEKAKSASQKTQATAYLSFDDMLSKEKLDILDICLPTYLHVEFAEKAMAKGIHVLMEKPLSLESLDVRHIYDVAHSYGVNVMVAQVVRFWREYVYLKELIDNGTYGRLLSGNMVRLGSTPKWSWDSWMTDPVRSGLVPFDLHIHDLDFLVYVFGKPDSVQCFRGSQGKQDYIHAIYQYADFFICAEAAWFDCDYTFRSGFRFQFEKAIVENTQGKLTVFTQTGEKITLEEDSAFTNGINLPACNAYYNEIRYFVDCALAGRFPDKIKPDELEMVLELITHL